MKRRLGDSLEKENFFGGSLSRVSGNLLENFEDEVRDLRLGLSGLFLLDGLEDRGNFRVVEVYKLDTQVLGGDEVQLVD